MTKSAERSSEEAMKSAYLAMGRMQSTIDAYRRERSEPIAIVGAGCRFPGGVVDPESYWDLLAGGTDAVREVPEDRWSAEEFHTDESGRPGRLASRWGGFLDDIDRFDHDFFGISRREALAMDPQQRLLLEVAWEALEDAGTAPSDLVGSSTGVFVGLASNDHASHVFQHPDEITLHMSTGTAHSVAAGRLSYLLDLRGPSVSLDTACSSSLVAVHQACQNLRLGECDLALAGGVNVLLSPHLGISFSQMPGMLSVDGRCKAFDAGANGFVRAEGCGVVVLKRLSDAVRDRDRMLAVVRGSAVNQDGRSSGLTAPNGSAQVDVLRRAVAAAGIVPGDVGFVEAHGTGTALGDPIEVDAVAEVYGRAEGEPLHLGAAKTNLGHLEAAAGVAGLIKAALSVRNGAVPPNLHFTELNPHIDLGGTRLAFPTELVQWDQGAQAGPRIAGVSSFGFSGTNAHVLVEQAPEPAAAEAEAERPASLLALSAASESALLKLARRYRDRLASADAGQAADICYSANTGRSHHPYRLAAVGTSGDRIAELLAEHVRGEAAPGLTVGHAAPSATEKPVFLFTGQGTQRAGMARALYETLPTFRRTVDLCDDILRDTLDRPLLSVLFPDDGAENGRALVDEVVYGQPALFAVEYAMAQTWRSWGVEPGAVVGHSLGEYVAACFAGVMSLEDGLTLVAERARLLGGLSGNGGMATVFAPVEKVEEVLTDLGGGVIGVAAVNGPMNTSISGERAVVEKACEAFMGMRVFAELLRIDTASHSPLVEPVLNPLGDLLGKVEFSTPDIPWATNLHGSVWPWGSVPNASYWLGHARRPVRFAEDVQALHEMGYRTYLEVGPTPVLLGLAEDAVGGGSTMVPSMRPMGDEWETLLGAVGRLYTGGVRVDWSAFDRDYARSRVPVPRYPFEGARDRYETDGAAEFFLWGRPTRRRAAGTSGTADAPPRARGRSSRSGDAARNRTARSRPSRERSPEPPRTPRSGLPTARELLELPADQRSQVLVEGLLRAVRLALGARSGSVVEPQVPLSSYGLDSLMAVELRNAIRDRLGVTVVIGRVLREASVRDLAEDVVARLGEDTASGRTAGPQGSATPIRRAARAGDATTERLLERLEGGATEPAEATVEEEARP